MTYTLTPQQRDEIINSPRTYRILQVNRDKREEIETGFLSYGAADTRRVELQRTYFIAHPKETTWTGDSFEVELINGDLINRALLERRFARSEES